MGIWCWDALRPSKDIQAGFEALFNMAYNAPSYHVPMGRLWKGSRHEVQDEVARLEHRPGDPLHP